MFAPAMKCPECSNTETKQLVLEGDLVADRCDKCKGTWMDKGELAQFVSHSDDFPQLNNSLDYGKESKLKCPRCAQKKKDVLLTHIPYAANSETELFVDFCRGCQGMWLEKTEINDVSNVLKEMRIKAKKDRMAKR